jgi:hypothetical protein
MKVTSCGTTWENKLKSYILWFEMWHVLPHLWLIFPIEKNNRAQVKIKIATVAQKLKNQFWIFVNFRG